MGNSASLYSRPWRTLPQDQNEILTTVRNYKPQNEDVTCLNILLYGPTGAGKSNFINSVESAILGRISGRDLTDAMSGVSFTRKFKTFKIWMNQKQTCSFVFNDTMGLEEQTDGICIKDIKLVLKGHVEDGYKFDSDKPLTQGNEHYIANPSLANQTHILVFVVAAGAVSRLSEDVMKKMRDVRLAASELDIPQMAILTKVDEACPEVERRLTNVHRSKLLKEKVDQFHQMLGIPVNCIFLVKNYMSEIETNETTDAYILLALRQIIRFGEDFLNNQ